MEGDYLWEQWCKSNNHPNNYSDFKKKMIGKSQEEVDEEWGELLELYDNSTITPKSFGRHLKRK